MERDSGVRSRIHDDGACTIVAVREDAEVILLLASIRHSRCFRPVPSAPPSSCSPEARPDRDKLRFSATFASAKPPRGGFIPAETITTPTTMRTARIFSRHVAILFFPVIRERALHLGRQKSASNPIVISLLSRQFTNFANYSHHPLLLPVPPVLASGKFRPVALVDGASPR